VLPRCHGDAIPHPQGRGRRVGQPMSSTRADGGGRRKRADSPGVRRCQSLPNKGIELTGNSVRSFLAPAIPRSSCLALACNRDTRRSEKSHDHRHRVTWQRNPLGYW
jgi:hypothetical protein